MRVRHYTRRSSRDKIMADQRIVARDQNRVFVERARGKPLSPRDAEDKYGLDRGKGAAYVEFDSRPGELGRQRNRRLGIVESFIKGDVDLSGRDAKGFDNS